MKKVQIPELFLIILNELSKMTCVQLNKVTLFLIEFKSNGYQSIALETGYNFAFGHVTIGWNACPQIKENSLVRAPSIGIFEL